VKLNVRTVTKILGCLLALPLVLAIGFVAYAAWTFKEDRVREGQAYGFAIGDTHEQVFQRALTLLAAGEIAEIHRWPKDSFHFAFGENDLPDAKEDSRWTMIVNPKWWNDSITLEFEDGRVSEIYRFRVCCEFP
jgi:hypothetical protein